MVAVRWRQRYPAVVVPLLGHIFAKSACTEQLLYVHRVGLIFISSLALGCNDRHSEESFKVL